MTTTRYEITFITLLYKLFKKPLFSAFLITLATIVTVFFYGMSSERENAVMLPLFIHMMTAVVAYAPGVFLRFVLYRRMFDKSIRPVSGTTTFMITALEIGIFLAVMSNGISAVNDTTAAFFTALFMAVFGTVVNFILLIVVLIGYFKAKREEKDFIVADYRMNSHHRNTDDNGFFHEGHYIQP